MAFTVLENISQDELNWYHESRYWMHVSDELTMKNAARREGLAAGRNAGIIETAKNLLKMNVLSHEQIAQATDLDLEKIKELESL